MLSWVTAKSSCPASLNFGHGVLLAVPSWTPLQPNWYGSALRLHFRSSQPINHWWSTQLSYTSLVLSATSVFCRTGSWRWSRTSMNSSAHASTTSDGSHSLSVMPIATWWSSSSPLSFWVVLITAILLWLVCHGQPLLQCNLDKMQLLDCQHVIMLDPQYENCTGCQLSTA